MTGGTAHQARLPRRRARPWVVVLGGTLAAAILAYAEFVYLHKPGPERIRDGISNIRIGMTEAEVDRIMGGRADESQKGNDYDHTYVRKIWRSGAAEGHVGFTNGRVAFKTSR